jgi:hypothetical protein
MDKENSFKRGFMQLKQKDAPAVKAEIMAGLGISTRMPWHQRITGKIVPKQSEREYIENVFKKYGIIDVWGDLSTNELKDRKSHLKREVQELVHFAVMMLGNDGMDIVVKESTLLSERIKSGKLSIDNVVTD